MKNIPVQNPEPNAEEWVNIITGKAESSRIPLVEYIIDNVIMQPICEEMLGRTWAAGGEGRDAQKAHLDNFIEFWYRMGYDIVRFEQGLPFAEHKIVTDDAAPESDKERAWADQHHGMITTWEEFEGYDWPSIEEFDFFPFEYLNDNLPDGMGLVTCHAGGIFEHLSFILSYEHLCFLLFDDPDLVKAVCDKVGSLMEGFYRHLLDLDNVVTIFPGDDMGFKTGTLIAPDDMRTYGLPWHKKFAAMTHEKGLPYFIHSCGKLDEIMDDLIDEIKIDAKHSYEDTIMPVEEFHKRYSDRIGVLGGIDLNILSGGSADDVRARVRALAETCGAKGKYAVGSGNSVPSYVPVENYLAMVDEALNYT
jgi:uroporphyrinogen decarboxylase